MEKNLHTILESITKNNMKVFKVDTTEEELLIRFKNKSRLGIIRKCNNIYHCFFTIIIDKYLVEIGFDNKEITDFKNLLNKYFSLTDKQLLDKYFKPDLDISLITLNEIK